jgi:hypothetical protein
MSIRLAALWLGGLAAGVTMLACQKSSEPSQVSAAEKSAAPKAASDSAAAAKAAADKAAADKVAADKAAADKAAADKAAADRAAVDKATVAMAAAEKAAADKAAADKAAADKAAADKAAAQAVAEEAALPPDLVAMKAEISRMTAQIDLTMAKLDALAAAKGDLEKPSEAALTAMDTLDGETQVLAKRGDQMRDRGAAYFEAWEKQLAAMSTPEVAAAAAKRKDELAAKYTELLTAMQETRAAMDAYAGDMKTIRAAIEDELTADSQKVLATQVKAAKDKATTLKNRVNAAFAKVGEVSIIYTKR